MKSNTPLSREARKWFETTLMTIPDNVTIIDIMERFTVEDGQGFEELVRAMIRSHEAMSFHVGTMRATMSICATALLLGAHLSKEGHL